jgi:hypothetical protein
MRYLMLIMEESTRRRNRSPEQADSEFQRMMRFAEDLEERGVSLGSASLKTLSSGVRIEVRNGKRAVFDGPFAETKEVVGGYILLECETKEQAMAVAGECPAAEWATVELRETGPCHSD